MLTLFRKIITYILLSTVLVLSAKAQYTFNMSVGDTYISGTDHPVGVIYDDGGPSANYSNSFHGRVIITSTPGSTIYIYGSYNTEKGYDYISIYDGSDSSALMQARLNGIGTIEPMPINTGWQSNLNLTLLLTDPDLRFIMNAALSTTAAAANPQT
mgnify:CR=1 FL=1